MIQILLQMQTMEAIRYGETKAQVVETSIRKLKIKSKLQEHLKLPQKCHWRQIKPTITISLKMIQQLKNQLEV